MDITNQHDTDGAFAMMVKNILPVGVKGFVTIGFIAHWSHLLLHSSIAAPPSSPKTSTNL
jgi:hypothetical protein